MNGKLGRSMIYTKLTKLAMQVAFDAHKEQKDKAGLPYIFHPFHLAEQMTDEITVCTALLHDVVEDTDMTFEHLSELGFTAPILDALKLLTHDKSVPYMDYVKKIAENPVARAVKLADLLHNSDLSRLDTVDEKALRRVEKYKQAMELLVQDKK